MRIDIVCVGKIKEKFYADAIFEYSKRLTRYCDLRIIQVADEKTIEGASENVISQIKAVEGGRILKNISEDSYVITLEIAGNMLDSVQLSEKMSAVTLSGNSHITFVIGGSLGLSDEVCKRGNFHLSFSRMTFPHQLMRVILLEQIYRAFRIMNNEPYHK